MKINYLTSNQLKFKIAQQFFKDVPDVELVQHSFAVPEIQDSSCEVIAQDSAVYAAKQLGEPCVVMDAGLFIEALGGFPGPFVKYINEWLTEDQIVRLLADDDNRSAYFLDALAIGYPDGSAEVFSYKTPGTIAKPGQYEASKWPANSLFIPLGHSQPLGLMSENEQADFWQQENKTWSLLVDFLAAQPSAKL